ncbi:MAG: permease [Candidatus Omnitrophica bacterium]|nr:permease [Candidatus Omnitrophota bacterium]
MNEEGHACHVQKNEKGTGNTSLPVPFSRLFRKPLFVVSLIALILLALSFVFPHLQKFRISFLDYVRIIWLPILLGFLVGGLIDRYIPREYISKILARRKKRTILYATGLGFLASACSHGVIALSMELHKKGASGPAVVSFLLASPWANLPITFLLIGFFGWRGVLIIMAALVVSMVTGLTFQYLDRKDWIEKNKHTVFLDSGFSIRKDLKERFGNYRLTPDQVREDIRGVWRGTYELANMVLWWILLGMVLASLVSAFIPEHIFHRFLGPSFLGLFMTLVIATVLEICSEGTSPLAFEIYKQTGALGNAFAFLMGGVVTDYTEVGLVWVNLGRRTALWMLGVTIPQVFLLGWIFNFLF